MTTITRGLRVQFENGLDVLRGYIVGRYIDGSLPSMEETWTCYADQVRVRLPLFHGKDGKGPPVMIAGPQRRNRNGDAIVNMRGYPKVDMIQQTAERWLTLVDPDGVQACDASGAAIHLATSGIIGVPGDPLQLVRNGVPVPFRVRLRRMVIL